MKESESRLVQSNSLQPHELYSPWNSPGQNTGVGNLSLLQGIFPTQGSNPGLLHCRWILYQLSHNSVQFTHLYLTLCDPMDCSTPGLPVHHQLPEPTQTHVHWVSDAIQPSHSLSSPSASTFNLAQHQSLSNESVLCIRWPKYWSFGFSISPSNEYSMNSQDWFPLG